MYLIMLMYLKKNILIFIKTVRCMKYVRYGKYIHTLLHASYLIS
jgi:hypothetical protein